MLPISKHFIEDDNSNLNASFISQLILDELTENKELIKQGDGDSTSGSDSAPSEDNLSLVELNKNLPVCEKQIKPKKEVIEKKIVKPVL